MLEPCEQDISTDRQGITLHTAYRPSADLLKGRVILVTGAGAGIGRTAAVEYSKYGATVLLAGRTKSKLEGVYDEIVDHGYVEPVIHVLDLAEVDESELEQIALAIRNDLGRLDGILHNAADLDVLTPFEHIDKDSWDRTMRVNVTIPFLLTKACMPLLRVQENSSVVFTTDECASKPKGYWGAYAVSKAAVQNFAEMLAIELQNTSVRVNCINPGAVRTEMRLKTHPGSSMKSYPLPEAIMIPYLYLMGSDSIGMRGQVMQAAQWLENVRDDR
ncbi:MAG: YciK family oxidoreductase [Sulfuriferula sp.]